MRWRACGLVGLAVIGVACASSRAEKPSTAGVEVRRDENGVVWRRLVSDSYSTASVAGASLVLRQTLVRYERSDFDDDDVTLTSRLVDDAGGAEVERWAVRDHAVSGSVSGSFYITHLPGLETSEALDRYYSLSTGRFAFATTDTLAELPAGTLPERRWIAFLAAAMPEALPCVRAGDLGALIFAGEAGALQTVVVSTSDASLTPFNPEWGLVDPRGGATVKRLPNAAGWKLPLPAEVRLAFDGAKAPQVRLPLGAQGFDVSGAVVAEGFSLERRDCASAEPRPHPEAVERHRASRGPWASP
jgi:hypothetical protein